MDRIALKGHSTFQLSLVKNKDGFYVTKHADKHTKERLKKQSAKQQKFADLLKQDPTIRHIIEVPDVLEHTEDEEQYHFRMRYYKGESILNLIETGDIGHLEMIIDRVFTFIRWCIEHSDRQHIFVNVLTEKVNSIVEKSTDVRVQELGTTLNKRLNDRGTIFIPVGLCHGDLTFSNAIFSHKIVFIDFLDSYIETPLQDLAKLLQEVNLKWSLLMSENVTDYTKVAIGYEHLKKLTEQEIEKLAQQHAIDRDTIEIFYLITLLRLVPYTKEEGMYEKILSEATNRRNLL